MKPDLSKNGLGFALLLAVLSAVGQGSEPVWNPATRLLALSGAEGAPWLAEGAAQIKFTGGQVLSTRDPRFKVTLDVLALGIPAAR